MWTRGAYGLCCLKGLREDRVLGFDVLTHDDSSMYLIFVCGLCETGNYNPVFALL